MSPGHSLQNDPLVHCRYRSSLAAFSGFWLAVPSGHGNMIAGFPLPAVYGHRRPLVIGVLTIFRQMIPVVG